MLGLSPLAGGGLLSAVGVFIPPYEYETMLTIEDGSIVADADSYVAIADVTTYAARYGSTWSAADELAAEQAILRAMLYIEDQEWRFCGYRVNESQELSWPRTYVPNLAGGYLSSTAIPKGIKNAVCEAAILELATPGALLTSSLDSTQTIKRLRQKADVLEKETEYFDEGNVSKSDKFEKIKAFLAPYICSTGVVDVVRA